jgi:phosphoglycerol transferase MdoB-like AlkP superfamily enzyme
MVFFMILRALFILYHIPLLKEDGVRWNETLAAFWYSIPLDTATACYLLIIPMFILTLQGFFGWPWINRLNRFYTLIVILGFTLISVAELGIFAEWKTKLTGKALTYIGHPIELYRSITGLRFFGFLFALILLTVLGMLMYNWVFYLKLFEKLRKTWWSLIFMLVCIPVLFAGLRGGFSAIPITTSAAYYSPHSILNWASVNSAYNLFISYIEGQKFKESNPFDFYPIEEAREMLEDIEFVEKDTTFRILETRRPNIVVLLMESWSADLIESLGGEPGITPEFMELEREGLLFSHLYASGNRSQQGIASIFSGFPAIPYTTITQNPDKYQKLPSMPEILIGQGYHTSFYFGGDLDYGNIRGYVLFNGVKKIIDEKDVPDTLPRGRLGIHDEFMMKLHAEEMEMEEQPFFSVLFTISSHSPYDQPQEHTIKWDQGEALYIKSAYYSDYSLGLYFDLVRQKTWYDSTLFIIIADHSHNTYRNWPVESFNYRKIPMLLLGGALKDEYKGKKIERISSNGDLPVTLLKQLGMDCSSFGWSRDLFNPHTREYAYFEINDGVGWKTPLGEFVYNVRYDQYFSQKMNDGATELDKSDLIRQGKSYVQVIFQTFLDM